MDADDALAAGHERQEGLLPFQRREEDDVDIEEERRLLFVGMTRAKQRLTLSRARYRMIRGLTDRTVRSGFLDELPRGEIDWSEPIVRSQPDTTPVPRGQLPDDIEQWQVGMLVQHPRFGLGRILSLERGAKRTHVSVQFKDGPRQSWVLEFAELERVDFDDVG